MEGKNAVFQKLKPTCVALSQAALALNESPGDTKAVTDHLETLKSTLRIISSKANTLDAKLAEYVFFPISQVLKASKKASIRILELCLQCVAILIDQGWQQDIPPQLAAQLVILSALLSERTPKGLAFAESTDELQASALWCLYHLFSIAKPNSEISRLFGTESNFPQLGQTMSVLLDRIDDGRSVEVQIAATDTLEVLVSNVIDFEIQASFLPGIVSKLTRVLTPQTKSRRNHKVIVGGLSIFEVLLRNTMDDHGPSQFVNSMESASSQHRQPQSQSIVVNEEWKEQAAIQLKPAITNIMKLKAHSREDVHSALRTLCLTVLKHCRRALANCLNVALETLITLSARNPDRASDVEVQVFLSTDLTASALLQTILYDWLQSLTTIMQGSDEQAKTSKLQQISVGYELLVQAGVDMEAIDRMLATILRDSVIVTLAAPSVNHQKPPSLPHIQSMDLTALRDSRMSMEFGSALIRLKAQEGPMSGIEEFTRLISSSASAPGFVADLARSLRQSYGETQIANFWLLLTATQSFLHRRDVDAFLNIETDQRSKHNEYVEELYSFSLSVLADTSYQNRDSRLQALALRSLALRAQIAGQEFRYELIDALYPVLHTLATPDDHLQQDSITTLNIFAASCGYSTVKDLIVENVDYLTNAVALKLNAFDVSPQAPQVLLMMVRLAGSGLLPYLEDTVESIFAALEDYHGYPLLVELLFKVLSVIAEEGIKAPQFQITDGNSDQFNSILLERWQPTDIVALAALLQERAQQEVEREHTASNEHFEHPKYPWKNIDEEPEPDIGPQTDQDQQLNDAESVPPATKTYNLLFKIAEVTQHFLPSTSPSLRTSLLSMIQKSIPAISKHENSFLPLINTLWPEVVSRLDDDEPYIVAAAIDVVRILCEHARDFMRTRIIELWPRLEEIHHATLKEVMNAALGKSSVLEDKLPRNPSLVTGRAQERGALARLQKVPGLYGDTSTKHLWHSITECLVAIVRFVPIAPEMLDQTLEMLGPVLDQAEVQHAFEEENGDALWLAQLKSGIVSKPRAKANFADVQWRYVEIPD